MSIIPSAQYATFGRILGIYRYLLHAPQQREIRKRLEQLISPDSLVNHRNMIEEALNESIKMRLFCEDGPIVALNPSLSPDAKEPAKGDSVIKQEIARLLFDEKNSENHRLAELVAWFLTQDPAEGAPSSQEFERTLKAQGGFDHLVSGSTAYSHFSNWCCDLGLGWRFAIPKQKMLVPDPTGFLRPVLPQLLPEPGQEVPIRQIVERLASLYPVFEGGLHREQVESWRGQRSERHLSRSTAMAWLRFEQSGEVRLVKPADAEAWIFPDADQDKRYSHIVRLVKA